MYLRLASCAHDHLIDFFFGRYDIIADVINIPDKEALYCYIARFIHLLKKLHSSLVACLVGVLPFVHCTDVWWHLDAVSKSVMTVS